ncbi:pregnancy-specific beta-1-glycoprotein 5-like [Dendropsophus ebraccatus]|uniref:pregnancy-specific beta-1-glycoprotein 5-like n=1 Tax=Dendropsophus ebraccatus TaxID=150705 RepID=UPI0038311FE6
MLKVRSAKRPRSTDACVTCGLLADKEICWSREGVVLILGWDEISGRIPVSLLPPYPVTGKSVFLQVFGVTMTPTYFTWYKGPDTSEENHILTYFPGNGTNISAPLYNSKLNPFPKGSLQISDLQITDSGNYSVIVYNTWEIADQGFVSLIVYDLIPDLTLTASDLTPREYDTLTLFCQAENDKLLGFVGPGVRFKNESIMSDDMKNLTFPRITRKYTGYYNCYANVFPVSSTSNYLYIEVAYGPDNVEIKGALTVNYGSRLLLLCEVDSVPQADFQWKHNNKILETQNANNLGIDYVRFSDQGTYTCEARNSRTQIVATDTVTVDVSATIFIAVIIPFVIIGFIIGAVLVCRKRIPEMHVECEDSDNEDDIQNSVPDVTLDNAKDKQEEQF